MSVLLLCIFLIVLQTPKPGNCFIFHYPRSAHSKAAEPPAKTDSPCCFSKKFKEPAALKPISYNEPPVSHDGRAYGHPSA